jgi:phosphatidylserine/phosphatidylglycerophosphate/cardiolipin synthase-like enzyme
VAHTAKRWLGASLLLAFLACEPDPGDALAEHRSHTELARTSEVIFSPQPPETTHNLRLAELIARSRASIDAAVYSLDNATVEAALRDAAQRGVTIRLIYEGAKLDRQLDADARAR